VFSTILSLNKTPFNVIIDKNLVAGVREGLTLMKFYHEILTTVNIFSLGPETSPNTHGIRITENLTTDLSHKNIPKM
jgi:hypothetical protein